MLLKCLFSFEIVNVPKTFLNVRSSIRVSDPQIVGLKRITTVKQLTRLMTHCDLLLNCFQLQRKASETSLKSQPTFSYSSERPMMLNNMTRKHSTVSLGGTPRSLTKKSVQPQPEKCPYCERNFGYKGEKARRSFVKSIVSIISLQPTIAMLSGVRRSLSSNRAQTWHPCQQQRSA